MLNLYMLIALTVPTPDLDYLVIDVESARNLVYIAENKVEEPYHKVVGIPQWKRRNNILIYCYNSIRYSAGRGNRCTTIIHPELKKLSDGDIEYIVEHLMKQGFEVEVNPISEFEIKIFWPSRDRVGVGVVK